MSERLRLLRITRGLSQEMLGHEVGLSQQSVSRIENNMNAATGEQICALAKYFQVSTDYLLEVTDEEADRQENAMTVEIYKIAQTYRQLSEGSRAMLRGILREMRRQEKQTKERER